MEWNKIINEIKEDTIIVFVSLALTISILIFIICMQINKVNDQNEKIIEQNEQIIEMLSAT